jgi:hypothetical protein
MRELGLAALAAALFGSVFLAHLSHELDEIVVRLDDLRAQVDAIRAGLEAREVTSCR